VYINFNADAKLDLPYSVNQTPSAKSKAKSQLKGSHSIQWLAKWMLHQTLHYWECWSREADSKNARLTNSLAARLPGACYSRLTTPSSVRASTAAASLWPQPGTTLANQGMGKDANWMELTVAQLHHKFYGITSFNTMFTSGPCPALVKPSQMFFWVKSPCRLVGRGRRYREPCCLHLQSSTLLRNIGLYQEVKTAT
jgi:hypothetical protein